MTDNADEKAARTLLGRSGRILSVTSTSGLIKHGKSEDVVKFHSTVFLDKNGKHLGSPNDILAVGDEVYYDAMKCPSTSRLTYQWTATRVWCKKNECPIETPSGTSHETRKNPLDVRGYTGLIVQLSDEWGLIIHSKNEKVYFGTNVFEAGTNASTIGLTKCLQLGDAVHYDATRCPKLNSKHRYQWKATRVWLPGGSATTAKKQTDTHKSNAEASNQVHGKAGTIIAVTSKDGKIQHSNRIEIAFDANVFVDKRGNPRGPPNAFLHKGDKVYYNANRKELGTWKVTKVWMMDSDPTYVPGHVMERKTISHLVKVIKASGSSIDLQKLKDCLLEKDVQDHVGTSFTSLKALLRRHPSVFSMEAGTVSLTESAPVKKSSSLSASSDMVAEIDNPKLQLKDVQCHQGRLVEVTKDYGVISNNGPEHTFVYFPVTAFICENGSAVMDLKSVLAVNDVLDCVMHPADKDMKYEWIATRVWPARPLPATMTSVEKTKTPTETPWAWGQGPVVNMIGLSGFIQRGDDRISPENIYFNLSALLYARRSADVTLSSLVRANVGLYYIAIPVENQKCFWRAIAVWLDANILDIFPSTPGALRNDRGLFAATGKVAVVHGTGGAIQFGNEDSFDNIVSFSSKNLLWYEAVDDITKVLSTGETLDCLVHVNGGTGISKWTVDCVWKREFFQPQQEVAYPQPFENISPLKTGNTISGSGRITCLVLNGGFLKYSGITIPFAASDFHIDGQLADIGHLEIGDTVGFEAEATDTVSLPWRTTMVWKGKRKQTFPDDHAVPSKMFRGRGCFQTSSLPVSRIYDEPSSRLPMNSLRNMGPSPMDSYAETSGTLGTAIKMEPALVVPRFDAYGSSFNEAKPTTGLFGNDRHVNLEDMRAQMHDAMRTYQRAIDEIRRCVSVMAPHASELQQLTKSLPDHLIAELNIRKDMRFNDHLSSKSPKEFAHCATQTVSSGDIIASQYYAY